MKPIVGTTNKSMAAMLGAWLDAILFHEIIQLRGDLRPKLVPVARYAAWPPSSQVVGGGAHTRASGRRHGHPERSVGHSVLAPALCNVSWDRATERLEAASPAPRVDATFSLPMRRLRASGDLAQPNSIHQCADRASPRSETSRNAYCTRPTSCATIHAGRVALASCP